MSWTTPDDVVDAWIGDDAPDDDSQIQKWIDKAEREIRFRIPGLQVRLDLEAALLPPVTELLETAKDVVVSMVTRVFRNPEGIRQRNTTTGPFTESATYGGDVPGGLGLTGDELEKLRGQSTKGAFTISMIPSTSPFYGGSCGSEDY
jgi:hypothetical protein